MTGIDGIGGGGYSYDYDQPAASSNVSHVSRNELFNELDLASSQRADRILDDLRNDPNISAADFDQIETRANAIIMTLFRGGHLHENSAIVATYDPSKANNIGLLGGDRGFIESQVTPFPISERERAEDLAASGLVYPAYAPPVYNGAPMTLSEEDDPFAISGGAGMNFSGQSQGESGSQQQGEQGQEDEKKGQKGETGNTEKPSIGQRIGKFFGF